MNSKGESLEMCNRARLCKYDTLNCCPSLKQIISHRALVERTKMSSVRFCGASNNKRQKAAICCKKRQNKGPFQSFVSKSGLTNVSTFCTAYACCAANYSSLDKHRILHLRILAD